MPRNSIEFKRTALAALVALACVSAIAGTTWDPAKPTQLTIGSIVLGDTRYNDLDISFGSVVSVGNGVPTRTYDSFDASTGRYTVSSISVLGNIYTDVVVTLSGLVRGPSSFAPIADIVPNDPLFADQWHLKNTGQHGRDNIPGKVGEDLNVLRAWNYATGTGIQIAVVDDGLDINHEDLHVVPGKSWDYRVNAYGDPSSTTGSHGTSCAGLAAARGNNGMGVTGVAFNARVVGYNLLSATTGSFGADSVTKDLTFNHIYSNSYGATDGNGLVAPSDEVWRSAIDTGINTGRGGKGVVYTWAAGNGAGGNDRSDYDGQANYQGVLAIGSLNDQGQKSSYSESGSNLLVMAFGGEFCSTHTTTTVDITGTPGYNDGTTKPDDYAGQPNYTRCMNGTSAATPEASGTVALLLETNPALTWRDVRAILARTARKNDAANPDWVTNGGGYKVNHNYGYGAIDATSAVKAAQTWSNLSAQKTTIATAPIATPLTIPDDAPGITSTITLNGSGISKLEFVDVNITSNHAEFGDLEIILTSPAGTHSTLAVTHNCVVPNTSTVVPCTDALKDSVRFGVARLMGEAADGNWTLSVRDAKAGHTGSLSAWGIKVYGY